MLSKVDHERREWEFKKQAFWKLGWGQKLKVFQNTESFRILSRVMFSVDHYQKFLHYNSQGHLFGKKFCSCQFIERVKQFLYV